MNIDRTADTEKLENELRELSAQLEDGKMRFQLVRDELARRHAANPNDQPAPTLMTEEQMRQNLRNAETAQNGTLINKLIAMEAEQAKLVVEAEIAKAAKLEAEERLALVTKYLVPKG